MTWCKQPELWNGNEDTHRGEMMAGGQEEWQTGNVWCKKTIEEAVYQCDGIKFAEQMHRNWKRDTSEGNWWKGAHVLQWNMCWWWRWCVYVLWIGGIWGVSVATRWTEDLSSSPVAAANMSVFAEWPKSTICCPDGLDYRGNSEKSLSNEYEDRMDLARRRYSKTLPARWTGWAVQQSTKGKPTGDMRYKWGSK